MTEVEDVKRIAHDSELGSPVMSKELFARLRATLGLNERCTKVTITLAIDDLVHVEATFTPQMNARTLVDLLGQYALVRLD